MPLAYLDDLADDLLEDALDGISLARTGRDPPTRTFISHGDPVADECCDAIGGQLSVHLARIDHRPFDTRQCQLIPQAEFHVVLFRCVPGLGDAPNALPAAADLDTSAGELLEDLWAMLTYLYARHQADDLFDGVTCNAVKFGEVVPLAPEGGCAGWDLTLTVDLSDTGP